MHDFVFVVVVFFLHFTSPKSSTRKKQKQEKQFRDTWLAILIVMFFSQKGGFTLVLFHVTGCVSADYSLIVRHFSMLTFILVFDLFYKNRDNTVYPSLYPVLVILSRLYPSTMDGVDSVLNMSKFVPLVIG